MSGSTKAGGARLRFSGVWGYFNMFRHQEKKKIELQTVVSHSNTEFLWLLGFFRLYPKFVYFKLSFAKLYQRKPPDLELIHGFLCQSLGFLRKRFLPKVLLCIIVC